MLNKITDVNYGKTIWKEQSLHVLDPIREEYRQENDPWTTWVCTARVHFYVDFFFRQIQQVFSICGFNRLQLENGIFCSRLGICGWGGENIVSRPQLVESADAKSTDTKHGLSRRKLHVDPGPCRVSTLNPSVGRGSTVLGPCAL